ncbi:MAG: phosphoadenylyl-sulfate reductase [Thermoanaerobaculia bacterium]|nr:phosphoadenylyl-sulfate reductase [Thermoanaerobaculia bacterium]
MSLATIDCGSSLFSDEIVDDDFRFGPETPTEDFVCWTLERFKGWRRVFTTSFGMEGCALVDMYARRTESFEVSYLDTGFFFDETYELIERMRERYPHVAFVDRGTRLTPEAQAEAYGDELWKTDPDRCCQLRKVEPLRALMGRADIWISGLRRSQSPTRAGIRLVEWDPRFDVLKLNPLTYWERSDVWSYVQKHDVPYNPLHERGYPSVGCTHCTVPVNGLRVGEYTRLGRWNGRDKTECGLHFGDGGK